MTYESMGLSETFKAYVDDTVYSDPAKEEAMWAEIEHADAVRWGVEGIVEDYLTKIRMGWLEDTPDGTLERVLEEIRSELR